MSVPNINDSPAAPRAVGLQRSVRLLAVWSDEMAEYKYVLHKYTPPIKPKWMNFLPPACLVVGWNRSAETTEKEKIKRWMEHYGIEIEFPETHKQPNDSR